MRMGRYGVAPTANSLPNDMFPMIAPIRPTTAWTPMAVELRGGRRERICVCVCVCVCGEGDVGRVCGGGGCGEGVGRVCVGGGGMWGGCVCVGGGVGREEVRKYSGHNCQNNGRGGITTLILIRLCMYMYDNTENSIAHLQYMYITSVAL